MGIRPIQLNETPKKNARRAPQACISWACIFPQIYESTMHNEPQKFYPSHPDSHKCLDISMDIYPIEPTGGSLDLFHALNFLVPFILSCDSCFRQAKTRQILMKYSTQAFLQLRKGNYTCCKYANKSTLFIHYIL